MRLVEHIAKSRRGAMCIIHVNYTGVTIQHMGDMVEEIVTYDITAEGPIVSRIKHAGVARLLDNVVDFVELDDVVVTIVRDGHVGCIVDEVVGHPVAYPGDIDCRLI